MPSTPVPPASLPVAAVERVTHRYGDRVALDDVSLTLERGTTALIGVNGAGKSTLLQVLAGAIAPTAGDVTILGYSPYRTAERRRALATIALMPQTATFPPGMTAQEVVEHIGWLRGLSARDARTHARRALAQVGLEARFSARMKQLSGGMARRVALAQAIVAEPAVLLLDEPSTGLDPQQRRMMVDLVKGLNGTLLFSSHVIEDVLDVAGRVVVLDEGRIAFDGPLDDLLDMGPPAQARATRLESAFLALLHPFRRSS